MLRAVLPLTGLPQIVIWKHTRSQRIPRSTSNLTKLTPMALAKPSISSFTNPRMPTGKNLISVASAYTGNLATGDTNRQPHRGGGITCDNVAKEGDAEVNSTEAGSDHQTHAQRNNGAW